MTKSEYLKFLKDIGVKYSKIVEYGELKYNYVISITYVSYGSKVFRISKFDKDWNLVESFTRLSCLIFGDLEYEEKLEVDPIREYIRPARGVFYKFELVDTADVAQFPTGKRVEAVVDRYHFSRNGKTFTQNTNIPKLQRTPLFFKWNA
jgi:hypothetical protein